MRIIFANVLILILLISCENKSPKTTRKLNTLSINESKKMNIFSHSYSPRKIKLNDTISFNINEAWCEKSFNYTDLDKDKKQKNKIEIYHIVIVIDKNLRKEYSGFKSNDWTFNDMDFGQSKGTNYLVSYARELTSRTPLADTLEIKLNYSTPPDNPGEFWKTNELGSFFLYKEY